MSYCNVCPRKCNIDRSQSVGFCREGDTMRVSRIAPHFYEEPPISYKNGSGTVFFAGCNLRCVFCQNKNISQGERIGKEYSQGELIDAIVKLQESGVHNINLVTPTHFAMKIAKMLETQGTLFSDIPSVWPLKGGVGHISMAFGQNAHPITKQWYIHKGLDFSTWRSGDPIIATANGQVVTVTFDNAFGNYVIIKHKHGFYTRYAHMNSVRVKKGQYVSQGDVIGTLGNTGLSTGPHLHYEVHIGSDVVDPAKYINVKLSK